jgi:type IV pilus assembly protein PilM
MSSLGHLKRWLLTPEPPGVGVEFRPGEIVIARFDEGGRGVMDLCLRAPIPPGVVDFSMLRPNLVEPEALTAFLKQLFEEAGVKGTRIGLTLPDMLARISLVDLPGAPRPRTSSAEVVEMLRFRLKKSLPFDAGEARLSYQPAPAQSSASGSPLTFLTGIMHESVASQYEGLFADLGFHVGAIETSSLSLLKLWEPVVFEALSPEQDYFFLNLEETYFTVSLVRNRSRLVLVRTVGHRSPLLDTEALDFRHRPSYEADGLLRELLPTFIYYQEKLEGNSLARVYYRSLRPDLGDLAGVLEEQFQVPAEPFDLSRAVKVGSHLTVDEPMASVAGAASGVARGKAA